MLQHTSSEANYLMPRGCDGIASHPEGVTRSRFIHATENGDRRQPDGARGSYAELPTYNQDQAFTKGC